MHAPVWDAEELIGHAGGAHGGRRRRGLRAVVTARLDLSGPLTCDWRDGDVW
jgi:hypothetical protein